MVTGFYRFPGIADHWAWVWNHGQHGVWLEQGAHANWVWGVNSLLNGASGIRLEEVSGNIIGQSIAWSNPVSLHMIHADRNTVYVNGIYGDAGHAMAMENSHGNGFYWNHFACRNGWAVLRQGSGDNFWHQNTVQCPVVSDEAVASR